MPSYRTYGVSFLLGVAAGVAVTHPEVRRKARPLVRKGIQQTLRLKRELEKLAAAAGEDLEDFVAEANAEYEASDVKSGNGAGRPAGSSA